MSAAASHPVWCSRKHAADWPLHHTEVGGIELPAYDNAVAVHLLQRDGETVVQLGDYRSEDTIRTNLTVEQAVALARLLDAAAALAGARPHDRTDDRPSAAPGGPR